MEMVDGKGSRKMIDGKAVSDVETDAEKDADVAEYLWTPSGWVSTKSRTRTYSLPLLIPTAFFTVESLTL